jgi:hypothetical protein
MNTEIKTPQGRTPHRQAPPSLGPSNKRETAQYIADLSLEMRNLAKSCDMPTLQGLLEVAYYEAFTMATEIQVPAGESERLRQLTRASNG